MSKIREILDLEKQIVSLENAYKRLLSESLASLFRGPDVSPESVERAVEIYHRKMCDLKERCDGLLGERAGELFSQWRNKEDTDIDQDEIVALWELVECKFKNNSASIEELLEFMEV